MSEADLLRRLERVERDNAALTDAIAGLVDQIEDLAAAVARRRRNWPARVTVKVEPEQVLQAVSAATQRSVARIMQPPGKGVESDISREVAMLLLREAAGLSYRSIGELLDADHRHAARLVERLRDAMARGGPKGGQATELRQRAESLLAAQAAEA